MSFTKFASFEVSEVLEVKGADAQHRTASLDKVGDYSDYRTGDGYLYARITAISSRVNKNNDGWPSVELAGGPEKFEQYMAKKQSGVGITVAAEKGAKYGFSTFLHKPIFIDHHNSDTRGTRGVIVDAKLHIDDQKQSNFDSYYSSADVDPEHLPPTKVELLLEIDAKSFPKFAKALVEGSKDPTTGIDGFSMGCDVERSKCSHCNNEATNPHEYCSHIKMKGAHHDYTSSDGKKTSRKSYENCYGIGFFEISGVFDPADETALMKELIDEGSNTTSYLSMRRTAENPLPQSELPKAPAQVDTLREEKICPVCGETMENEKCETCGYIEPPKGLDNPKLDQSQVSPEGENQGALEEVPPTALTEGAPDEKGNSYLDDLKSRKPSLGISSNMTSDRQRVAGKINVTENPLKPSTRPVTDEPKDEHVTKDQTKPVTSSYRTAMDLIQAAKQRKQSGDNMSDRTKVAAEPADPSANADKQVSPTGVGGVYEDSNESASKPDVNTTVPGKGGVHQDSNQEASNENTDKESLPTDSSDNAGFDKTKNQSDSGPTKTFDNSNEPDSAVTDKAFPTASQQKQSWGDERPFPHGDDTAGESGGANQGTQPADPVGKAQDRVDVLQGVNVGNPQKGTDQWTGTDGNGVTRQQNPVTKEVFAPFSSFVTAMKLADTEVELGLTPVDKKYDRVAELEGLSPEELEAEERVVARVKTAGLGKQRRTASAIEGQEAVAGRLPSFAKKGAVEERKPVKVNDELLDSSLFIR